MVVNTATSVFFRYVLRSAVCWSEEVSRYLMVWLGFLGMSLAIKGNEHINITFFINSLSQRARTVVKYVTDIIVLAFLGLVLIHSINHLITVRDQTSVALMLPMYIPYASVTVGAALMILQSVRSMFSAVRRDPRCQKN